MKKIILKDVESYMPRVDERGNFVITAQGSFERTSTRLNYKRELLALVYCTPVGQGFTLEHMRRANTVMQKLEETPTNCAMFLEDADWNYLCQVLDAARFRVPTAEVVAMIDSVKNAVTESPEIKDKNERK